MGAGRIARSVLPALLCLSPIAAPAAVAAQPEANGDTSPARILMIGRWTDDGDCEVVTVLHPDGTFTAPNGARGFWEVNDGRLKLWGPGGTASFEFTFTDADTLDLTSLEDGTRSQSTRCVAPGEEPADLPVS